MYVLVIAMLMIGESGVTAEPNLIEEYNSLEDCRQELILISKLPNFRLGSIDLLGYAAIKETEEVKAAVFCVKNYRSI